MTKYLLSLLLFVCANPVMAQTVNVVAQAKADLLAHGVDLSGSCGATKLTNLVASRAGYGLLHKAGGYRAVLKADGSCLPGEQSNDPEGFATDYLIDPKTGFGYDILQDAGGANEPRWAGPETAADMVARNWANFREPFDPSPYFGGIVPLPPVVFPPPVVPPAVFDAAALAAQIAQLQLSLDTHARGLSEAIAAVNQNVTDGRAENRGFFGAVRDHWKSITMVVGPIVTYFTTRQMTGK